MELSKSRKLYALNYTLKYIKDEKAFDLNSGTNLGSNGICYYLSGEIEKIIDDSILFEDIIYFIPEFKMPKNLDAEESNFWWDGTDFDSRIAYLENLIKQIENESTETH